MSGLSIAYMVITAAMFLGVAYCSPSAEVGSDPTTVSISDAPEEEEGRPSREKSEEHERGAPVVVKGEADALHKPESVPLGRSTGSARPG